MNDDACEHDLNVNENAGSGAGGAGKAGIDS